MYGRRYDRVLEAGDLWRPSVVVFYVCLWRVSRLGGHLIMSKWAGIFVVTASLARVFACLSFNVKMSLDQFRPQSFAPIRVNKSDLSQFFAAIRDRKVVAGDPTSFRVSDKPFEESNPPTKVLGSAKTSLKKLATTSSLTVSVASKPPRKTPAKKASSSGIKKPPKKRARTKLEAQLQGATL